MLVLDGGDLFLRGEFEQLKDYQRTLNFPFLCGNLVHEETGTLLPLETAASPARGAVTSSRTWRPRRVR